MDVEVHLPDGKAPSILLDGKPVEHVTTDLRIDAGPDGRVLTLRLHLGEVRVKGKATVVVSEGTAEALAAIGWTPPKPEKDKEA